MVRRVPNSSPSAGAHHKGARPPAPPGARRGYEGAAPPLGGCCGAGGSSGAGGHPRSLPPAPQPGEGTAGCRGDGSAAAVPPAPSRRLARGEAAPPPCASLTPSGGPSQGCGDPPEQRGPPRGAGTPRGAGSPPAGSGDPPVPPRAAGPAAAPGRPAVSCGGLLPLPGPPPASLGKRLFVCSPAA